MLTKDEGLQVLIQTITKDKRHKHYDYIVKLSEDYFSYVTGIGLNDKLASLHTREDKDTLEQRKKLTNSPIPTIIESTKNPFGKVTRTKPLVRKIDYKGKEFENKKTELEDFIKKYNGSDSLEKYLEFAIITYNYIDPNAFLVTEFKTPDISKEKAQPYPFIVKSKEAVDYQYDNGILQYLIAKIDIKYLIKDKEQDGEKYIIYLGNDIWQFTQIDISTIPIEENTLTDKDGISYFRVKDKLFIVEWFEPKAEEVQAIRFGFIKDEITSGETFVSVFHKVIPLLNKTLNVNSELDLSMYNMALPKEYRLVPACNNVGCNHGNMPNGTTCSVCHGTGKQQSHTSVLDVTELDLPKDQDPTQIIDLSKLIYTHLPPVEGLRFFDEFIKEKKKEIHLSIFGADLVTKAEISVTATEKNLERDNLDDILLPFARKYSEIWKYTVKLIAEFTDNSKGLILEHIFPSQFKFKTLSELMSELQIAKLSGASSSTVSAIEDDINELLYADRPDELKRIRIKNQYNPFKGYPIEQITIWMNSGKVLQRDAVIFQHFQQIFNDLEKENPTPWFYDLAPEKIDALFNDKVDVILSQLESEKPKPMISFKDNFNKNTEQDATT